MKGDRILFDIHKGGHSLIWVADDLEVSFDMHRFPGYADAPPELQQAARHGVKQKIADAAAIGYAKPDGSIARPTVAEKFAAMRAVADRLPEWNADRGESMSPVTFEAVSRYQSASGKTLTRERWEGLTKEQRASIAKLPGVMKHAADIRAERSAPETVAAAEAILDEM